MLTSREVYEKMTVENEKGRAGEARSNTTIRYAVPAGVVSVIETMRRLALESLSGNPIESGRQLDNDGLLMEHIAGAHEEALYQILGVISAWEKTFPLLPRSAREVHMDNESASRESDDGRGERLLL